MSEVGYYRYKTTADQSKYIRFNIDGTNVSIKYIEPVETCQGDIIIKYLDKDGQYRFYPFNKYYRTFDTPELIGTANKFVTNILSDQTDKQSVGFRNERKIQLRADVSNEILQKLVDIYTSPRVYMYIGSGTSDSAEDWLEVAQESPDAIVKRRKANAGRIELTITLPKNFSITML